MSWFNYYGLIFMIVIMVPNIVFAIKYKDSYSNAYKNKVAEFFEQIGRYACLVFMIFNIPYTYFNFWFDYALIVYLSLNSALCFAYLIVWIIYRNKNNKIKTLLLSIIPSCIFLFSGIILINIPLIIFAIVFAVNHILISYQNANISNIPKN